MNEQDFDPYAVLGIQNTATLDDIQLAYKRAASKAHPDREGGSTERMTDVNMAYKILSDPEMRARFDAGQGIGPKAPIEVKARDFIIRLVKDVIRATDVNLDMIRTIRTALNQQRSACQQQRRNTQTELQSLRIRLNRLKGPPENFIEAVLLQEIDRGEATLPMLDADEAVMEKALELLRDYSYGSELITPSDISLSPCFLKPFSEWK